VHRLAFLVLLFWAAACAPAASPAVPGAPAAPGGTQRDPNQVLQVALGGISQNLTPQGYATNPWLFFPLYDPLTQLDTGFAVRPALAERWELSQDGRTWQFTIRSDAKFSNGDPVTADDVAFTVQQVLERSWPQRGFLQSVTGASAVSPTVAAITTRVQDLSIPNGVAYLWIIPKRYWEASGGFDGFSQKPIGSGPYELVEFRPGETARFRIRAERHPYRQPANRELVFRAVPDNAQTINGLRAGELDLTILRNFTGDQADQLRRSNLVVLSYPVANSSVRLPQGTWETRDTPLKDPRVRQALNYAVNREAIARQIYSGFAEPVGQNGVPGSLYWDPDLKPWPYDPAKARQLLAEAGYANGFRATLDYSPATAPASLMLLIQADLRAVGVDLEIIANELGVFIDKVNGRNNQQKGDLVFAGVGDSTGFNTQVRGSTGCGKPAGAPPSAVFWCDPRWDDLLDRAQAERDPVRRAALYREAVRLEREAITVIFTVITPQFHVHQPKIAGLRIPLGVYFNLDSAYRSL
jgi:peptide/nickel transport system substrate-binding protein